VRLSDWAQPARAPLRTPSVADRSHFFSETLQKMLKNLFTSRALCADFGLLILRAGLTLSLREIL